MAIKEDIVRSVFSGSDIFSKYARKKFGVKERETKKPSEKTPTKAEAPKEDGVTQEAVTILKIIAKNTMAMPGIARDMNVLRQNLQKLVTLKGGDKSTGADAYFLKADEREAALEAQKQRISPTPTAPGAPSKPAESGGGILGSIISFFSTGFVSAFKSIFSSKMLMKAITKVFLPLAIIASLFSGIKEGFQRYKETGSFSEAVVAGLGGMLNFVSFGLFGEDTLKNLWSSISDFMSPITDTISRIFDGIKNFFLKLFGKDVPIEDVAPQKIEAPKPKMPDAKEFAVSTAKASGASDEKAQDLGSIFEAAGKGDTKSLFEKAQQFAAKYPEPSPTEVASTPQTTPSQQITAQPGTTGETATPTSPSPVSSSGDTPMVEKHRKLAKEFSIGKPGTPEGITQEISYVKMKRDYYAANRDKAMELGMVEKYGEYDKIVGIYEARINELLEMQNGVGKTSPSSSPAQEVAPSIQPSSGGTAAPAAAVASSGAAAPTMSSGGPSISGSDISTASSGATAPTMFSGGPSISGSDVSTASSMVAEAQRMEASADMGSVVNAPVNTNSMSSAGKQPSKIASAYDEEFATLLATT